MKLRHILEYAVFRLVTGVIHVLPTGVSVRLARGLASMNSLLIRPRLAKAEQRIEEVFGSTVTEAERRRIAREAWSNLHLNAVELVIARRLLANEQDFANVVGLDRLEKHLATGRGAVIAMAHVGNWELAGLAARRRGVPIFFLARRQNNPLMEAHLARLRQHFGVTAIDRDSHMLRDIVRRLKGGEVLAILTDLRARRGGLPIRFLGKVVWLPEGAAAFARMARVPVFPATARRTEGHRHEWTIHEPIEPGSNVSSDGLMMQRIMDTFDGFIRKYPDQFFWFNARWVLQPRRASTSAGTAKP